MTHEEALKLMNEQTQKALATFQQQRLELERKVWEQVEAIRARY